MICKIPFEFISIESEGVHLVFEALLNQKACKILIDTGASRSVFDSNRIGLFVDNPEISENDQLSTGLGTNSMKSHMVILENVKIGDLKLKNYSAVIIDMTHINESFETMGLQQIDGVLGGDILLKYKAEIDYRRKELRLRFSKKKDSV